MKRKNIILQIILWVLQGFIVGIGAILPGVSGGTLCYVFGIYDQILEVLSDPFRGIKKHWMMLCFVVLGGGLGFVGFAGVVNWLRALNEGMTLCIFAGLIIGTLPDLWKDAGKEGRGKGSLIAIVLSFISVSALFYLFENIWHLKVTPGIIGWIVCGFLWGLSFIVPGVSSSGLIEVFGLNVAMNEGIYTFDFSILIPMGIAMLATLLLFSRLMKFVFDKFFSVISHCVMGFVIATTLMILPSFAVGILEIVIYILCILAGAVASFLFTKLCNKIKA